MNTNDHDFIIKTVVEFYSEEEINSAQHLLFETCEETNLRMKTYRKDAAKLYCRDIMNKFNEAGVHCPTFVAVNIAKLPVVTADAFNLARISKDIMSILSIEKNEANSLATLDCLQSDVTSVLDKCSKIDVIANELERLKFAIDRRNGRRVIESDSSTPESNSLHSTIDDSTNDDTDDDDDDAAAAAAAAADDDDDAAAVDDDDVFSDASISGNAIIDEHTDLDVQETTHSTNASRAPPILRLRDGPCADAWMTEGGFSLVGSSTQRKKIQVSSQTFVNTSRKNTDMLRGALKTIVPHYHGNDRRHGGYSRENKMCDIFISRLVPETTARDVNNFLMPRLNRNVKIEQMRTKYDNYSSFKLCVPMYLKNKVLDKNFWENNNIYVRNFVQQLRN